MRGTDTGQPPLWLWLRVPLVLSAAAVPLLLGNAFTYDLAQSAALYALLALGYSIVLGLCGQFSVAHAALYAVGAYTTAILTTDPHDVSMSLALLAAVGVGLVAGAVMGLPALRLHGDQLAVVTLFAGGIVQVVLQNASTLTGGLGGITDVPANALLGRSFVTLRDQYLLATALLLVAIVAVERLRRSRLGLSMLAVREDEVAARAAGVRLGTTKITAFALSGAVAGAAGWLYAGRYATVTPARFDVTLSVLVAVMVLLAGPGRTYAVVASAALLGILERVLSDYSAVEEAVTGATIVLIVLWRAGALRDLRHLARWRR